jgi:predicted nucleic acid-binding protein
VLIAVDTNVLLDQALGDEDVLDALSVIRERLQNSRFIVTPTVLQELAWIADNGDTAEEKKAASKALGNLREWGYEPLNVVPVGNGIVEQIGLKLRIEGVVPEEEENDACIIAEAALIGCAMLLSSDTHLLEAQENRDLGQVLTDCDVEGDRLVIGSPRTIVQKFFRRR